MFGYFRVQIRRYAIWTRGREVPICCAFIRMQLEIPGENGKYRLLSLHCRQCERGFPKRLRTSAACLAARASCSNCSTTASASWRVFWLQRSSFSVAATCALACFSMKTSLLSILQCLSFSRQAQVLTLNSNTQMPLSRHHCKLLPHRRRFSTLPLEVCAWRVFQSSV